MTSEQIQAIFLLAGIEVLGWEKIPNQYWPDVPAYQEVRQRDPWYLVKTNFGVIKLGWRKRVISIDWEDCVKMKLGQIFISKFDKTKIFDKAQVTGMVMRADRGSITSWDTGCHAYTLGTASDYIRRLIHTLSGLEVVDVSSLNA